MPDFEWSNMYLIADKSTGDFRISSWRLLYRLNYCNYQTCLVWSLPRWSSGRYLAIDVSNHGMAALEGPAADELLHKKHSSRDMKLNTQANEKDMPSMNVSMAGMLRKLPVPVLIALYQAIWRNALVSSYGCSGNSPYCVLPIPSGDLDYSGFWLARWSHQSWQRQWYLMPVLFDYGR